MKRLVLLMLAAASSGCPEGPPPLFPADYAATYVEVRDCRRSGDHDLNRIRVLADPLALVPYMERAEPFPEDAIVMKEEYEYADLECTGPILQWTVMQRLAPGADPDALGWAWQRVNRAREVVEDEPTRCAGCHVDCGIPPDGYEGTCTVP